METVDNTDEPRQIDMIRFSRIINDLFEREADTIRDQLNNLAGPHIFDAVCTAVRPRILALELADRGEAHDMGAIWRDRTPTAPGPIGGLDTDRDTLEQMCLVTSAFAGDMLRWFSAAIDVPAGLEDLWWIATNILEASEDTAADHDDIAELEQHLRNTLDRATRIRDGQIDSVRTELADLYDSGLRAAFTEAAEDLAILMRMMGGTEGLDAVHEGPL